MSVSACNKISIILQTLLFVQLILPDVQRCRNTPLSGETARILFLANKTIISTSQYQPFLIRDITGGQSLWFSISLRLGVTPRTHQLQLSPEALAVEAELSLRVHGRKEVCHISLGHTVIAACAWKFSLFSDQFLDFKGCGGICCCCFKTEWFLNLLFCLFYSKTSH